MPITPANTVAKTVKADFTGIAVTPHGDSIFVSDFAWGGVYRSDDLGLSWVRLESDGLVSDRVWALGLDARAPDELLAAPVAGGLHLLTGAKPRR